MNIFSRRQKLYLELRKVASLLRCKKKNTLLRSTRTYFSTIFDPNIGFVQILPVIFLGIIFCFAVKHFAQMEYTVLAPDWLS